MIVISYIIIVFTALQLLTVITNLIFKQRLKYDEISGNPLVSVLIPARNEEENIECIINDIKIQGYENIEILVFDDNSTDRTPNIVSKMAKTDKRIRIIKSSSLPKKWLGKNWACHNLSQKSKGEYLLFMDADVRTKPDMIEKTVAYSQNYDLGLLSIFPMQIMETIGEKLTVPLMHYILITLLPLILVRVSRFKSHSAANGQFMLFKRQVYSKYSPHKRFKSEKVEDIRISRFLKSKNIPVSCITGSQIVSCKMYNNYNEAINGFSKNIIMFFGNSYTFAISFWLINTLGILTVIYTFNSVIILSYCAAVILIRILFSITAKQNIVMNLILFIPQMLSMLLIIIKSVIYKFTKKQRWKERYI